MTCEAGGTCAFIGTGNTDKVVLHALGLVPRSADLLTKAAGDAVVATAVGAARRDPQRREERSAVVPGARQPEELDARLERGGRQHELGPPLPLHRGVRRGDDRPGRAGRASPTRRPSSSTSAPLRDTSFFTLAVEKAAGEHSGLDSTIKHLLSSASSRTRPTLEGPWSERLARRPRAQRPHPAQDGDPRPVSGIVELRGNFTDSAIFKRAGMTPEAIDAVRPPGVRGVVLPGRARGAGRPLQGPRARQAAGRRVDAAQVRRLARANFGDAAGGARRARRRILERGGARASCCGSWW